MSIAMKPDSNRLMAVDALIVFIISAAICVAAQKLWLMSILVPALITARFFILSKIADAEGINMAAEAIFFAVCLALGAFNDWNSVTNRQIYHYTVPHFFKFSEIPLWMFLFWGMILRSMARFTRWEFLGPVKTVSNRLRIAKITFDNPALKVAAEIALVFASRQAIYRFYDHPVYSWLPFLAALIAAFVFFRPDAHDRKLLGVFLFVGPLVEIAYIRIGGLHHYALGWFAGVPLWIVLWWLLAVLIWKDLAYRIEHFINRIMKNV